MPTQPLATQEDARTRTGELLRLALGTDAAVKAIELVQLDAERLAEFSREQEADAKRNAAQGWDLFI